MNWEYTESPIQSWNISMVCRISGSMSFGSTSGKTGISSSLLKSSTPRSGLAKRRLHFFAPQLHAVEHLLPRRTARQPEPHDQVIGSKFLAVHLRLPYAILRRPGNEMFPRPLASEV